MHSGKCFIIIPLDVNHVECHHSIPICLVTNLDLQNCNTLCSCTCKFCKF